MLWLQKFRWCGSTHVQENNFLRTCSRVYLQNGSITHYRNLHYITFMKKITILGEVVCSKSWWATTYANKPQARSANSLIVYVHLIFFSYGYLHILLPPSLRKNVHDWCLTLYPPLVERRPLTIALSPLPRAYSQWNQWTSGHTPHLSLYCPWSIHIPASSLCSPPSLFLHQATP